MQESSGRPGEDPTAITIVCELDCPPEAAWTALTRARDVATWWGDHVTMDARPGGTLREVWRDGGREVVTTGRIVVFDPPRRLTMAWKDMDWSVETDVTFRLDPDGLGTALTLIHAGWDRFSDTDGAALRRAHEAGWRHHLDSFAALLSAARDNGS